jgi:diadenylate cyclase
LEHASSLNTLNAIPVLDRLRALWDRVGSYSILEVGLELIIIWFAVYVIVRFVQGTRAAGALKGLLVVVILVTIVSRLFGQGETFQRLGWLYDKAIALTAIALIVIFQPELRRALVRLGETSFLRSTPKDVAQVVDAITDAATYLSRAKFGAIIVIERQSRLTGLIEGGTALNAELSARLLQTIFFPGSALHDLAVVIAGKVVKAAGVQLPLAEPAEMPDPTLGSRHRAAVGLSRESDALVVVVSEETGGIRIAERGRLTSPMTAAELRDELRDRLGKTLINKAVSAGAVAKAQRAAMAGAGGASYADPSGESMVPFHDGGQAAGAGGDGHDASHGSGLGHAHLEGHPDEHGNDGSRIGESADRGGSGSHAAFSDAGESGAPVVASSKPTESSKKPKPRRS